MKFDLQQLERKTVGYWFADGLVDMFVGGVFLLLGLLLAGGTLLKPGYLPAILVGVGQPLIIFLAFFAGRRILPAWKDRYVYPRTGYVEYKPRPQAYRRKRMIRAGVVGGLMAASVILILPSLKENIIWFIAGVLLAIFLAVLAYRTGLYRYLVMAGVATLCGAVVSTVGLADQFRAPVFYGVFGLCWAVLGGVTFLWYLRHNARTEEK